MREWINHQPKTIQAEVWKRLTTFLSTGEINEVVSRIEGGKDLLQAHEELGLVDKYLDELNRIVQIIKRYN